ncbi:Diphthine methyltransferase [Gonapodya sp. JEL0774]|nr:Diphthine methyltransferase [Gonapodya sp. JEL0774]
MSISPHTTSTWHTPLCADSIEFCPIDGFRDVFVVGTYQLREGSMSENDQSTNTEPTPDDQHPAAGDDPDPRIIEPRAQVRDGSVHLRTVSRNAVLRTFWVELSVETSTIATQGGVLDMKCRFRIKKLDEISQRKPRLAVSHSSGSLSLLTVTPAGLEKELSWHAHDLEAWCVTFGAENDQDTVYSGADDAAIKLWDVRGGTSKPRAIIECHSAGVTSLTPHPHLPYLISTSYDQHIILHDIRLMSTTAPLGGPPRKMKTTSVVCALDTSVLADGSRDTEGGAWRARWHPTAHHGAGSTDAKKRLGGCLAVALMRSGWCVVDVDVATGTMREKARWGTERDGKGERRLAYGVDWSWEEEGWDGPGVGVVGGCSFYDMKGDLTVI